MTRNRRLERQNRYSAGSCRDCASPRFQDKAYCEKCLKKNRDRLSNLDNQRRVNNSRQKLKDEVFESYGGYICACCGETIKVFLSIDHVNGGGRKHITSLFGKSSTGDRFYRWLRKNNFPPGFQVLCFNCNWAKHRLGKCPHNS